MKPLRVLVVILLAVLDLFGLLTKLKNLSSNDKWSKLKLGPELPPPADAVQLIVSGL